MQLNIKKDFKLNFHKMLSINSDKSVQYSLTKTGILYLNKFLLEIM